MLRVARHAGHWVAAVAAVALVLVALNLRPAPAATTPADDPSASPVAATAALAESAAPQVAHVPMSDVITPVPRPVGTISADPTPTPPSVSTPPPAATPPAATPPPPVPTPTPPPPGPTPVPVADPNPATYTTSEISGSFGQSLTLEGYTVMLRRTSTPPDSQCLPLFAGDAFEMTIHYTTWFMSPNFEYNGRGDSCMDPNLPIVPGAVYTVLLLERTDAVTIWISPNEGSHSLAFRFR